MKLTALALGLLGLPAAAQGWRVDLDGQDPSTLTLAVVICLGIAFFLIRSAFARSKAAGQAAAGTCMVLAVVAVVFPATRGVLALLAAGFLVYGFFCRS